MKKILNWIFEFLGLRRVIRFEQLYVYNFNDETTDDEIRKILEEAHDDAQFHVGVELEISESDKCGTILIQRDLSAKDYFLVCKIEPFSTTPWQRMQIKDTVILILNTKNSECRKFEKWGLLKRAIEGKAFGEY